MPKMNLQEYREEIVKRMPTYQLQAVSAYTMAVVIVDSYHKGITVDEFCQKYGIGEDNGRP